MSSFRDAAQQVEIRTAIGRVRRPDLARRLLDSPQDDCGVAIEGRSTVLAGLREHRLERRGQAIGRQRRRPMLVDHAARRRFERAGERRHRFDDVVVDERLQFRRLVTLRGSC